MNYERQLQIMCAAVMARMDFSESVLREIKKGILDGVLRIERVKLEEKRAKESYYYFAVEHIQEGFGIWNSGGFDLITNTGRSVVAAGLDGERLRVVRHMTETNGRHTLAVIYQGCYIVKTHAENYMESDNTFVFRVENFSTIDGVWKAKCSLVFRLEPRLSRLTETQEARIWNAVQVSNRIAISPNLTRLKEWT